MKVPYKWLKEFLPTSKSLQDIDSILTLAGLEVDAINGISPTFTGVITARVISAQKHPESDRLQIAKVDTGKEILQIVCGAKNCREGLITALAQIGATLHMPKTGKLTIQKTSIRNVESFGMLCALEELGLEESSEGIHEFPADTAVGIPVESLLLEPIFEISLTPNLGHCFSILGVARELSYQCDEEIRIPTLSKKVILNPTKEFQIEIQSSACHEFHMALLRNIQVKPSPNWLVSRLKQCGMKSINNIVDALNYVMLEIGQPMHAYDFDKLASSHIVVSELNHSTPSIGLDSVLRTIPKESLVISSKNEIIALAGIIGSESTMVTEKTTNLLIESAHFSSKKIRQGMKNLGMRTEAGAHFEKGIDRKMILIALTKAIELILSDSNKTATVEYNGVISLEEPSKLVKIRTQRVNQIIGIHLSLGEIESILHKIGCKTIQKTEDHLVVNIPSYRNDLNEEIDLIEEVARIYGFNNIEKSAGFYRLGSICDSPVYQFEQEVRGKLTALGLQEIITCNLISPKQSQVGLSSDLKEDQLISVLHAKSIDQSILRPSLLPTFLNTVTRNFNFQTKNLSVFEIGRVHFYDGHQAQEKFAIGLMLVGKDREAHFSSKGNHYTFFHLKGIIESFLESFGIKASYVLSTSSAFHPGQQSAIIINDEHIGQFGQIHPIECKKLGIETSIYFAQIDLIELMKQAIKVKKMQQLPEYPSSSRDITLTLNKVVSYEKVLQAIQTVQLPILKKVECIDLFNSDDLGPHHHNLTLRMTYRSDTKTLDYETVEKGHQAIVSTLSTLT